MEEVNDKKNKINCTNLNVGDVVCLKSAAYNVSCKKTTVKSIREPVRTEEVYSPVAFVTPYMVVSEIFVDDKVKKELYSAKNNIPESKQVKSVGTTIRVKCVWFYEGKLLEKVFWHDTLILADANTSEK